jgi:TPR repeat protein
MKKSIFLLLLIVCMSGTAFSQAAIAKLKYEEAEEAYVANDFTTTLAKLEETEKMLGAVNPRILYLRIMAQDKLRKTQVYVDIEQILALKKNCVDYLTKYENVDGIEDKYKEVYKISEVVKSFNTEDQAFVNAAKGNVIDLEKIAQAYDRVDNDSRAIEWYTKAAAKNSSAAYYALAIFYVNGLGVKKDSVRGLEWLDKAVAANHPGAWYTKGMYFRNGNWGMPVDKIKYKECMQRSYDAALPESGKGNAFYTYYAAKTLLYGELDTVKGIELLIQASDRGDLYAMDMLASLYKNGSYVVKDVAKAMQLYRKAAEKGSSSSMYSIAYLYYKGADGIPNDYDKAVEWFIKAAEHGHSYAAFMLGYMYGDAKGVKQDLAAALTWYKLAGDRGHNGAVNNLGNMYYWGSGVTQDYSKAVIYYAKAGEMGNVIAMNNAGNTYHKGGFGLTQNYTKAIEWYIKGISSGYAWCMFNYANMLYNGQGTPQDYMKAKEYYEMAAAKENTDAMDKLYSMYYNGIGVKKDKKIAQQWLDKATAAKAKKG